MHTNVILASLRVEVGSERVGATPFRWAEFGCGGLSSLCPRIGRWSGANYPAKSPFFRLFLVPDRYSLFRPNISGNRPKVD